MIESRSGENVHRITIKYLPSVVSSDIKITQ